MKAKQIPLRVTKLLIERSQGVCELCGMAPAVERHHRCGRQMGGSREAWVNEVSNLLHVCHPCHAMVTDTRGDRPRFERLGWLVRRGVRLPAEVPVYGHFDSWGGTWVRLADDGAVEWLSFDDVTEMGLAV